jgi:16S rRNA (uracil1498-N3)-methyltransferase
MHRFFIPFSSIRDGRVYFPSSTAHQIFNVLRLKQGQQVIVLDNQGWEYLTLLEYVSPRQVEGVILQQIPASGEPSLRLTQREKFEWTLQKCTEVGVSAFVPMITERTLVRDPEDAQTKYTRWQRILQEAAEQSGRGHIPALHPPVRLHEAVQQAPKQNEVCLFAWEGHPRQPARQSLSAFTPPPRHVALCIGPEGGFTPEEAEAARRAGWNWISLGTRTLRMETAAILAAAFTLYEWDQL